MKASFPQPPSERSDVGALSKSPRLKSVHFNRQEVSEAEQRQNELQELHEKVEALAMILGKAKTDREELLGTIDQLKTEKRGVDKIISECAKKRVSEETSFRDILRKERARSETRIAKQREIIESRESLLVELSVCLTTIGANYPHLAVDEILQKTWNAVPAAYQACQSLRTGEFPAEREINTSPGAKEATKKSKKGKKSNKHKGQDGTDVNALTSAFASEIEGRDEVSKQEAHSELVMEEDNNNNNSNNIANEQQRNMLANLDNFMAEFNNLQGGGGEGEDRKKIKAGAAAPPSYSRPNPKLMSKQGAGPAGSSSAKSNNNQSNLNKAGYKMVAAADEEGGDGVDTREKLMIIQDMLT